MMLEAIKLCKSYNAKLALKDLSISVAPGDIFCLLGQNGAEKQHLDFNRFWSVYNIQGLIFNNGRDIYLGCFLNLFID